MWWILWCAWILLCCTMVLLASFFGIFPLLIWQDLLSNTHPRNIGILLVIWWVELKELILLLISVIASVFLSVFINFVISVHHCRGCKWKFQGQWLECRSWCYCRGWRWYRLGGRLKNQRFPSFPSLRLTTIWVALRSFLLLKLQYLSNFVDITSNWVLLTFT